MQTDINHLSLSYNEMVRIFCDVARKGLVRYYPLHSEQLPYTTLRKENRFWNLTGDSVRYAAICQIGIQRWLRHHPEDMQKLPDLWSALKSHINHIGNIGDIALCLWVAADSQQQDLEAWAKSFTAIWLQQKNECNAVELGWVVQAGVISSQLNNSKLNTVIAPVLEESHRLLAGLFRPQTGLFQRNYRGGRLHIDHVVSCFADQVYPILAMATYGELTGDVKSKDYAALATDSICRHQGTQGQWMWHYDTQHGKVCEEYPVFSVHQHSMAPLAILASDRTNKTNHTKAIELGMRWIWGSNELGENLVSREHDIIWRDIERRELPKISRFLRGLCCVYSLDGMHRRLGKSFFGFKINYECRPYEYGWILYAWADYKPSINN
jgi:hypothetical protein